MNITNFKVSSLREINFTGDNFSKKVSTSDISQVSQHLGFPGLKLNTSYKNHVTRGCDPIGTPEYWIPYDDRADLPVLIELSNRYVKKIQYFFYSWLNWINYPFTTEIYSSSDKCTILFLCWISPGSK